MQLLQERCTWHVHCSPEHWSAAKVTVHRYKRRAENRTHKICGFKLSDFNTKERLEQGSKDGEFRGRGARQGQDATSCVQEDRWRRVTKQARGSLLSLFHTVPTGFTAEKFSFPFRDFGKSNRIESLNCSFQTRIVVNRPRVGWCS